MSRIIVKGLSPGTSLDFLKNLFSPYGTISDLKIIKDKLGNRKDYVFIGFSEKKAGEKCIKDLGNSLLETKKIKIEKAYKKEISTKNENQQIYREKNVGKNVHINLMENLKENGHLFIRNIPLFCSKEDIGRLFKPFGFIFSIKILNEKKIKKESIEAIINFGLPECAIKAACFLDGKVFKGRILHIIPFKNRFRSGKINTIRSSLEIFKRTRLQIEKNNTFNLRSWFFFFFPK